MESIQQQVEQYNTLIDQYHALDHEIDTLLSDHHGHTENMTSDDMALYRKLARQRDDVFNAMRVLGQDLFVDDNNEF